MLTVLQNLFDFVERNNSYRRRFILAFLLRFVLFAYGIWQDANFALKYTDIDYYVYTDAAAHVAKGETPFMRATYRYTPVLAYLLWPTHVPLLFSLGKFCYFADLCIGFLLYKILIREAYQQSCIKIVTFGWLFNPISFTISTRGNADSLVGLLCLLTIYLLMQKRVVAGALVYGFVAHFKYPIVYVPAILVFLDQTSYRGLPRSKWRFHCLSLQIVTALFLVQLVEVSFCS